MKVKYNTIGKDYNVTRKADPLLTENLIQYLAPDKEGIYLDIGCGTGSYTHELQKRGYRFIGIDPSERMLTVAKKRNSNIEWRLGTAENTGLSPHQVDGITGSLTIHHWTNLEKAFQELYSILKPGGKIVIFTSTPKQMKGYWLNHYFPKMLEDSIIQMPALAKVQQAMERAGFEVSTTEKYFIQPDLEDKFLYCGKHHPEMYFDPQIRNGISSFSSLSNKVEVEHGLTALKSDIDSGKINQIISRYENQLGDYLYIIGKKQTTEEE
ncbi:MAG: class I SAM-dependent methyltransferase [Saprospiraceae bacterium]|nr:class I SAM-dependent methyltransferase [Saprospiraceae bacterium]